MMPINSASSNTAGIAISNSPLVVSFMRARKVRTRRTPPWDAHYVGVSDGRQRPLGLLSASLPASSQYRDRAPHAPKARSSTATVIDSKLCVSKIEYVRSEERRVGKE